MERFAPNTDSMLGAAIAPSAFFAEAVENLTIPSLRPEIRIEEIEPPRRLAPYTHAVAARVIDSGSNQTQGEDSFEKATGRLVLLYDPAGHEAWQGSIRLVAYITAHVEPDIASDPALASVAWAWLTEALETQHADRRVLAGAVTTVASTRFGEGQRPERERMDIELRASWTPLDNDLSSHAAAWARVLAQAAGLPPVGVTALR